MKLVAGLGNPGPTYQGNRHNLGWWVVDRLAYDWGFGSFETDGRALVSRGEVDGAEVLLLKPTTYMNLSGAGILPLVVRERIEVTTDLLVVVDDAALPVRAGAFSWAGEGGGTQRACIGRVRSGHRTVSPAPHRRGCAARGMPLEGVGALRHGRGG